MRYKGLLIIISGPSGSGKGTICKQLLKDENFEISVSATTRKPRDGEINGESYFFLTKEEFDTKINNNEFIEYAEVYGNFYGTPKRMVMDKLEKGINIILEIDIQGALNVKELYKEAVMVFLTPPSMEELKSRIIGRNSETEESLNLRFQSAFDELRFVSKYDYLIVNDTIENAVHDIKAILVAEKCKFSNNKQFYEDLLGGNSNG